ncbi:MAG: hypothetical protein P1V97_22920, partial [Planctomycetota bacterium]|nr:hypothetical protein [Planctomycetota bacterium]
MAEKKPQVLCSGCQEVKATEHSDGWNAPICFDCQPTIMQAWERAHKRRGVISFLLIASIVYGLSNSTVQADPLLL